MALWMRAAALLAAALLGGCASLQQPTVPVPEAPGVNIAWMQRIAQLSALQGFELTGRVAVKGGGLSGALRWQQQGEYFALRIAGPFGAGALSLQGTPALVSIKGRDIDLTTTEPEQVLAARTGWRLPLNALRWWVLGLPAPIDTAAAPTRMVLDAEGRASGFEQAGWTLRYSDYQPRGSTGTPSRIEAALPTADGEWMATVIVQSLSLTP